MSVPILSASENEDVTCVSATPKREKKKENSKSVLFHSVSSSSNSIIITQTFLSTSLFRIAQEMRGSFSKNKFVYIQARAAAEREISQSLRSRRSAANIVASSLLTGSQRFDTPGHVYIHYNRERIFGAKYIAAYINGRKKVARLISDKLDTSRCMWVCTQADCPNLQSLKARLSI